MNAFSCFFSSCRSNRFRERLTQIYRRIIQETRGKDVRLLAKGRAVEPVQSWPVHHAESGDRRCSGRTQLLDLFIAHAAG
ncbi:hypothetical protein EOA32_32225 [Mesorhizobium sp. M1A.F.Ca.ET.072.01.1.1]|uniref:hypothetical protein n=1 Tax=Mesorhizobium sp. M1A.F.Ca.ET.072.01.1.1 TaxID=2496753 RepID=UPI000FD2C64E|nr:hypothetical protein [Mesorhizobium sp. M1A.F.Ca.ET.072.01.1.1]RUW46197.1 hypothetical protein EOA32_32225 [Mesorhizobium sp. M1A.F.Ca.ET.072.01.1.1]TIV02819.1 MAG: hypothetical protein E5W04_11450 [Mesorhizobium sp.]